ncbi:unnamed protein product [Closterium sp. NIES-54]
MEVARTSMTHAAFPHFQWSFAVRYAAHQLYLWPCVAEPESLLTLRWTGEVGDALAFWFYHLTTRGILSSQDVTFDESVCYYHLLPHVSFLVPPPPLFLVQGYPKVDSGAGSVGGTGAGGTRARGTGVGGTGAGGIGGSSAGGAAQPVQRRPFFWPQLQSLLPPPGSALRQVLSLPSSTTLLLSYCVHCLTSLSRSYCLTPLRLLLLLTLNLARPASPSVIRCLATRVNDPTFESAAASAFVAELLDFNAASCLDYFANLHVKPPLQLACCLCSSRVARLRPAHRPCSLRAAYLRPACCLCAACLRLARHPSSLRATRLRPAATPAAYAQPTCGPPPPQPPARRPPAALPPPLQPVHRPLAARPPPLQPASRPLATRPPPLQPARRPPTALPPPLQPAHRWLAARPPPVQPTRRSVAARLPPQQPARSLPAASSPPLQLARRTPAARLPPSASREPPLLQPARRHLEIASRPLRPAAWLLPTLFLALPCTCPTLHAALLWLLSVFSRSIMRSVPLMALLARPSLRNVPPPPLPPPTPQLLQLTSMVLRMSGLLLLVGSAAAERARVAGVVEVAAGMVVGATVKVVGAVGVVAGVGALVAAVVAVVGVAVVAADGVVAVGVELFRGEILVVASGSSSNSVGARPLRPSSFVSGFLSVGRLGVVLAVQFGDEAERPCWAELLRSGVAFFDLDYNAILAAMYAFFASPEGDCYRCVPPDPGIQDAALGASE